MLWSKQIYLFDVNRWLDGDDPNAPPPESRKKIRNIHWRHLNSMRILSMPDKWEFPWFAAWDLAFQCITLSLVDPGFAKENLWLLLFEQFQHPNGQIPAYEWEFSDLNPPVHAWACWRVYQNEKNAPGKGDIAFLEKCFHKLLMNFAWWVNRVDQRRQQRLRRRISRPGQHHGRRPQRKASRRRHLGAIRRHRLDGLLLSLPDADRAGAGQTKPAYEVLATKFFEHFVYIGAAMKKMGGRDYQLWDEQDGFFYDVLRYPDGEFQKFRLRSMVGLIPLFRRRSA